MPLNLTRSIGDSIYFDEELEGGGREIVGEIVVLGTGDSVKLLFKGFEFFGINRSELLRRTDSGNRLIADWMERQENG